MNGEGKAGLKSGKLTSLVANILFNILPGRQDRYTGDDAFSQPVVAAIFIVTIGFLSILLFVSHFVLPVQTSDLRLIDAFCSFSVVGSTLALIILRSSQSVSYALQAYMATLLVGLVGVSLFSGGYASPANICLLVLPVLAMFGIGPVAGLFWFVVILTVLIMECVAGYFGILPDSIVVPEYTHVTLVFALLSSYIFIFSVVYHYKTSSAKLLGLFKQESSKYIHIANHDSLTGLASRRCFMDALDEAVVLAKGLNARFCVLFFDLNEFKEANDRYGHDIGDQILTVFAKRLFASTRSYNLVGRIGGDEFAVLLEDMSDEEKIKKRIDDYGEALSRPFRVKGEEVLISASIGYAIYPVDGQDRGSLLQTADHNMYREKRLFYCKKAASAFSKTPTT